MIWLHGLGDSSGGFHSTFEYLNLEGWRIVLPNAPKRPITINRGMRMRAWYDMASLESNEL
jgi:phospholipase/carboxylesterase